MFATIGNQASRSAAMQPIKTANVALVMLLTLGGCHPTSVKSASICKGHPAVTGSCRQMTGLVGLSADSGMTLSPDDGGQSVVLLTPLQGVEPWPANLSLALNRAQDETGNANATVHGVFEVCPLPAEIAWKLYGCVASARQLRTAEP